MDTLTSDVSSNTTRLLNYAGPNWRSLKNLEANISDIKVTSLQLKDSLHKFVDFSEGCLGNAVNAPDKGENLLLIIGKNDSNVFLHTYVFVLGISIKLHPLVLGLEKIYNMISYSVNALHSLGWKLDILNRNPNVECEYSEDSLDMLISCAKLLIDDIRQIASFIKVILIF